MPPAPLMVMRVPAAHTVKSGQSCTAEIRTVPFGPLSEVSVYADENVDSPAVGSSTLSPGDPAPDGSCVFTSRVPLNNVPATGVAHYRIDVLSETHSLILTWRIAPENLTRGAEVDLPLTPAILNY